MTGPLGVSAISTTSRSIGAALMSRTLRALFERLATGRAAPLLAGSEAGQQPIDVAAVLKPLCSQLCEEHATRIATSPVDHRMSASRERGDHLPTPAFLHLDQARQLVRGQPERLV